MLSPRPRAEKAREAAGGEDLVVSFILVGGFDCRHCICLSIDSEGKVVFKDDMQLDGGREKTVAALPWSLGIH